MFLMMSTHTHNQTADPSDTAANAGDLRLAWAHAASSGPSGSNGTPLATTRERPSAVGWTLGGWSVRHDGWPYHHDALISHGNHRLFVTETP